MNPSYIERLVLKFYKSWIEKNIFFSLRENTYLKNKNWTTDKKYLHNQHYTVPFKKVLVP